MTAPSLSAIPPLTTLTEDEIMFRDAVRDFAQSEVGPLVDKMERAAEFDRSLIPKFAELGLMGIDVPMELGGAGGSFFMAILAVEELAAVDASTSVLVDVQNTLVNLPLMDWVTNPSSSASSPDWPEAQLVRTPSQRPDRDPTRLRSAPAPKGTATIGS